MVVPLLVLLAAAASVDGARVETEMWLGTAYTPAGASNTLWWPFFEQYAGAIDRELGSAARHFGFNSLRVFLHTLAYEANATGLLANVGRFLTIASSHGFRVGLVLFDACWLTAGANVSVQCVPQKGVHNGCWYESPQLADMTTLARYQPYVEDVVRAFGNDSRVLYLEIYNEPRGPGEDFVFALRDAGFRWASSLWPQVPVISCWDDNNDTQIVDHHEYDVAFLSAWLPALYSNVAKGSVITEGGSRWYQPPFSGDYGSPLTVLNFLQALRVQKANGSLPFVPGAMLNWELMVGNSNTRWHWGSTPNASEPAIPWDGWMFPDGTPVSYTEAAAMRRYVTGVDEFLIFAKFMADPPVVADGDFYLTVAPGTAWIAPQTKPFSLAESVVIEASMWVESGGAVSLVLSENPSPASVFPVQKVQQSPAQTPRRDKQAHHHAPPENRRAEVPCAWGTILNNTDVCPGGPVGYRDLSVGNETDPLGACAAVCCAWDACTAWIVRPLQGTDNNCTDTLCCWLKPNCPVSQTVAVPGATAQFKAIPPGPALPISIRGYNITLDSASNLLTVFRQTTTDPASATLLGQFSLSILENGLVVEAWNLLRVVATSSASSPQLTLSIYFNPMFPETGFVGDPTTDATRAPTPLPPRLVLRDPAPLSNVSALVVAAGSFVARVDYISALPGSVLSR